MLISNRYLLIWLQAHPRLRSCIAKNWQYLRLDDISNSLAAAAVFYTQLAKLWELNFCCARQKCISMPAIFGKFHMLAKLPIQIFPMGIWGSHGAYFLMSFVNCSHFTGRWTDEILRMVNMVHGITLRRSLLILVKLLNFNF